MALYTVSSSGQIKIADTGLKTPVSFFTPEGIATGAVAASPIAGNNSRVYIIDGRSNRFQSNGQLQLIPGSFITGGNALAATSLGEIPLSGGSNFYLGTQVVKAFIKSANQSLGNLKLTGATGAIIARRVTSSGNLKTSGSHTQTSLRKESSSGQLVVTGNKVAPSTRQFSSSGQLKLLPADAYRIILIESTTDQLKLTGNSAFGLKYNSRGNLKTTGAFTRNVLLQPTSTGLITVATKWYTVNRIGGLSTETIASAAIASGTGAVQNTLNTTRIAFYGVTGLTSTGNLTITSYGTPDSDLTQDGVLAGSPLATSSIAERRFNPNSTQFRQLQNIDSAGYLKIDNSVKYRIDSIGAQLVLNGTGGLNSDRKSKGNLVITGSHKNSSLRTELSSGQIRLAPTGENPLSLDSSIGGSALASLPLAGGVDLVSGVTKFSSLRTETTRGNLKLNGLTGVGLKRLSSGRLTISGSVVTRSLRNETSTGQLKLTGSVVTRSIRIESSSGQLKMAETDAYRIIWAEESRGYLVTTGSNVHRSIQIERTSGQLRLSSVVTTRAIFATRSSSNLKLVTASQNPLTVNNSALAASPLGTISIAGGFDLPGYSTLFGSRRTELTLGTLVTTGTHSNTSRRIEISNTGQLRLSGSVVTRSLRTELTSGQLRLTGNDYNTSRRNEISSGQLRLSGSVVTRSLRNERSSGQLKFYPADAYRIYMYESSTNRLKLTGTDYNTSTRIELSRGRLVVKTLGQSSLTLSNSLAGSALASLPLAGGIDQLVTEFKSLRNEISRGRLTTSSTISTSSLRIEHTTGNLTLLGSTVWNKSLVKSTTGSLIETGSTVKNVSKARNTAGQLLVKSGGSNTSLTVSGSIAGSAIADHPVVSNYEYTLLSTKVTYTLNGVFYRDAGLTTSSSGRLILTGQSKNTSTRREQSTGNLVLSGTHTRAERYVETTSGRLLIAGASSTSNTNQYRFTTSGQLLITGTRVSLSVFVETTSGQLKVTGIHAKNIKHTVSTSGTLVTTGTHTRAERYAESSAGQLTVNGTHTKTFIHSVTSTGSVIINGTTEITTTIGGRTIYTVVSTGNLHVTGSSSVLHVFESVQTSLGRLVITGQSAAVVHQSLTEETSSGNLVLTGRSVSAFVPKPKKKAGNGGGGYVYASSWDILKPYFPDDRHILGYRDLKTSGTGVVRVSGHSDSTFIPAAKVTISNRKSLLDYMEEVNTTPKPQAVKKSKAVSKPQVAPANKISAQAFMEDELLLNGSLLSLDPLQDELDRELL